MGMCVCVFRINVVFTMWINLVFACTIAWFYRWSTRRGVFTLWKYTQRRIVHLKYCFASSCVESFVTAARWLERAEVTDRWTLTEHDVIDCSLHPGSLFLCHCIGRYRRCDASVESRASMAFILVACSTVRPIASNVYNVYTFDLLIIVYLRLFNDVWTNEWIRIMNNLFVGSYWTIL